MKTLKTLFTALAFSAVLLVGCATPENVRVEKILPDAVATGDEFSFSVVVHNDDVREKELSTIDIEESFLEGILVSQTEPATTEEYYVFGYKIFDFGIPIPANSSVEVVFNAKAVQSGDFAGGLDVCVDGDASCLYNSIRMVIE